MKSRLFLFMLVVISAGLSFPVFSGNARGESYVKFSESADDDVSYYDESNVKRISGTVKVWTKDIWGQKMRSLKRKGVPIKGYENLSYSISLVELNCKDMTYRVLSYTDYDKEGTVLYISHPQSHWNRVLPGSMCEDLKNHVCR